MSQNNSLPINPILFAYKQVREYFQKLSEAEKPEPTIEELLMAITIPIEGTQLGANVVRQKVLDKPALWAISAMSGSLIGHSEKIVNIPVDDQGQPLPQDRIKEAKQAVKVLVTNDVVLYNSVLYTFEEMEPYQEEAETEDETEQAEAPQPQQQKQKVPQKQTQQPKTKAV